MTSPSQPRSSGALVDSSNPNSSGAGFSSGTRKAINERQRAAAEAEEEHERWRQNMIAQIWGQQ